MESCNDPRRSGWSCFLGLCRKDSTSPPVRRLLGTIKPSECPANLKAKPVDASRRNAWKNLTQRRPHVAFYAVFDRTEAAQIKLIHELHVDALVDDGVIRSSMLFGIEVSHKLVNQLLKAQSIKTQIPDLLQFCSPSSPSETFSRGIYLHFVPFCGASFGTC